jgi:REP element-mobilizing transposase RayT
MEFNKIYHVFNHANGSEQLFNGNYSYNLFLFKFQEYIAPVADIYAYCLMPNHFHFLVKIRSEDEVSIAMENWYSGVDKDKKFRMRPKLRKRPENITPQRFVLNSFSNFFNAYTRIYNLVYDRYGSMFIKNFKRKPVEDHAYFAKVLFYIHHNPVNHKFCKSMEQWYWSSYNVYFKGKKSFISTTYPIEFFGSKEALLEHHKTLANANEIVEDPLDYLPVGYAFVRKF